ncbi:MAG: sugar kinase [Acidobacteria bacterium]|nr:sugar kinase [Acidobacteriota bacterium]
MPHSLLDPSMEDLRAAVRQFAGKRVLIWGDFVADRFLHGSTTRVSREAPALVLKHEREEIRAGGAGNAALNAAALGASVTVLGYVGQDSAGQALLGALRDSSIDVGRLIQVEGRSTPVKTRVMAGGTHTVRQQILRIDQETAWQEDVEEHGIAAHLDAATDWADAVMISDYGLGTIETAAARAWLENAPGVPVILDSRHRLLEFSGVTAATPNEEEAESATGMLLGDDLGAVQDAGKMLLARLECDHLLITRGSHGMSVFGREGAADHLPAHSASEIADVTGAGDTVIAAYTLGLAAGLPALMSARVANVAASLAVRKHGTATVSHDELIGHLGDA